MISTKIIAVIILSALLIFVIDLIRRQKLTFKYAFSWLCVTFIALIFAVFDHLLYDLAQFMGFELPSNFIFFSLLSVLVLLTLLITVFLCEQNIRNDIMAQKIAQLECELKNLKNNSESEKK